MTVFPDIGGMSYLLKQAHEMGQKLKEMRERLRDGTFAASVGGDLVRTPVNGQGDC